MPNNNVIAVEALSCVAEVVVAGMFEVEVVFVVFNFLKADFPNEREDFLVLLVSGSSSSGSSWCFRLDLFLAAASPEVVEDEAAAGDDWSCSVNS